MERQELIEFINELQLEALLIIQFLPYLNMFQSQIGFRSQLIILFEDMTWFERDFAYILAYCLTAFEAGMNGKDLMEKLWRTMKLIILYPEHHYNCISIHFFLELLLLMETTKIKSRNRFLFSPQMEAHENFKNVAILSGKDFNPFISNFYKF